MEGESGTGPLSRGDRVDRYVIESLIGEGGAARVYRVTHVHLESTHALKVLHIHDAEVMRRLIEEGRTQASFSHPNVVGVTDALLHEHLPCLVLEFVDGPTLWALLQDYRPTLDEALEIFRGILRGVDAAHQHGLVHRDLKPDNVLLAPTELGVVPKVADFGLVKVLTRVRTGPETAGGSFMGTPEYMAPEQAVSAAHVDHRADMFSLGCILYELVTGQRPFSADSEYDLLKLLVNCTYTPPEVVEPGLPPRVVLAIQDLLVADPDRRLGDCGALMEALYGDAAAVRATGEDRQSAVRNSVSTLGQQASSWIETRSSHPAVLRARGPADDPVRRKASRHPRASDRMGMAFVALLASMLAMVLGFYVLRFVGLL